MTENEIRNQIVDVCRRLYARNMLAAADGNVSFRLSDERILFTPSGRQKAFITPEDIAITALNGEVLTGKPSGERLMHLEIYRRCPQARAVVHAHPPHAVAWSLARPQLKELPNDHLSEVILGAGRIPFVPYARPGSEAMGGELAPYLPECRALILSRHGAVCWGTSLEEALNGMERLEHSAQILWLAEQLGGSHALPREEVNALRKMREQMGEGLL
ncbi:MAG: class II aldolase/adducin family protein [Bdellovibrionales bacterium]|nr:class II aldolase/adducin family protein [Bdellovibrionales bacterium]